MAIHDQDETALLILWVFNSKALEIYIANGKVCLVSPNKIDILNADGLVQYLSGRSDSLNVCISGIQTGSEFLIHRCCYSMDSQNVLPVFL